MTSTIAEVEIAIQGLKFEWPKSGFRLAIDSLDIPRGKKVAVVGPSGSGKTTLLNLMAGIISPETGEIRVAGHAVHELSDAARRRFRVSQIGMVFQQFELVPYLRAEDNILLPYLLNSSLRLDSAVRSRARELMKATGISDRARSFPAGMSQGEQQRLALCRALVTEPTLILADEPTGNLDSANKVRVIDLMMREVDSRRMTLVMVTHDTSMIDRFDTVFDFSQFTSPGVAP